MSTPLILHGTSATLAPGDTLLRGRDSGRRVHGFNDHIYAVRPEYWNPNITPEGLEGQSFDSWTIWDILTGWAAMSADVWCDDESHYEDGEGHYDAQREYSYVSPCMHVYAIMPEDMSTESENLTHETGAETVKYDCNAKVLFEVMDLNHLKELFDMHGIFKIHRQAA